MRRAFFRGAHHHPERDPRPPAFPHRCITVFVAEIQNPNLYELRLKSLDYTVYLNDRETGSGSLQKEISVPASSTAPVEIPVSARFGSLGGIAKMYISGQELPYRIEGKALVKAGLFDRTFPFSRTGILTSKKKNNYS